MKRLNRTKTSVLYVHKRYGLPCWPKSEWGPAVVVSAFHGKTDARDYYNFAVRLATGQIQAEFGSVIDARAGLWLGKPLRVAVISKRELSMEPACLSEHVEWITPEVGVGIALARVLLKREEFDLIIVINPKVFIRKFTLRTAAEIILDNGLTGGGAIYADRMLGWPERAPALY